MPTTYDCRQSEDYTLTLRLDGQDVTVSESGFRQAHLLIDRGLVLSQHGETLRIVCADGSTPVFSALEQDQIRRHKADLLALLRHSNA